MSEGKHTPGPWYVYDDGLPGTLLSVITNIDGEYFTDSPTPKMTWDTIAVFENEYGEKLANSPANARLIAAAPELLEALRRVAEHFPIFPDPDSTVDDDATEVTFSWGEVHQIRAAIAHAEGREP